MKRRSPFPLALAAIAALLCVQLAALAAPIEKTQLTTLLKFLEPGEVVQKIQSEGVAFDADDATLDELRQLGASEEVLNAIKAAANTPKPAPSTQPPITYDEVKALVSAGLPEARVLAIIRNSLTVFVLDAAQERELRAMGASDAVITALKGGSSGSRDTGEAPDQVIILDCSGSMQATTSDGQQKMEAAKQAVIKRINSIPDGLRLCLIVYGHDATLRCRAVEVVQPLEELNASNRQRLIAGVRRLRAVGSTPIALALDTANQELLRAKSPNCGVILVSDGKETCRGNPSREAAELVASLNMSYGLYVVGFDVSGDDRAALEEIARAAGEDGHYLNVADAEGFDDLPDELPDIPDPPEQPIVRRRGLKVLAPTTMPLPELSTIIVAKAGGWANRPEVPGYFTPITESRTYDREIRISSPDESYDIVWKPKEGMSVRMMAGVKFEKEEMVEVKPEDYLTLVKVTGNGLPNPKKIAFSAPDAYGLDYPAFDRRGQIATAFGETFVVPVGVWDLWIKPADGSAAYRVEQKVEIKPGVVNVID